MFDPFELLGLEKNYSLDLKVLEKHYFEAQKKTHPDRFVGVVGKEKKDILKKSSEINQAYLLLKDPLQRATFLIKTAGMEPLAHDPAFLPEVMLWNERLESGEKIELELQDKETNLFKDLEGAFKGKDYEKGRCALYRLTYVRKLLERTRHASSTR